MYIVHVTTEHAPIAKVGGLGDMVQGLSKACAQAGEQVEVILPFYHTIERNVLSALLPSSEKNSPRLKPKKACQNGIWMTHLDGIDLTLIESKKYFNRNTIYGEKDDVCRFAHFALSALDYLLKAEKKVDILHLHDWLTGLCAPLQKEVYQMHGLDIASIVTTIHNLSHQGRCEQKRFAQMGSKWQRLAIREEMQDHEKSEHVNCLKGAVIYSDFITTVSTSYAEEIKNQTRGLGPLLVQRAHKFKGILNGIDTHYWNPETDPFLTQNFSPDPKQIEQIIKAKKANRIALSEHVGISYDHVPLFISITRLVKQKGPELIKYGIEYVLKKGGQFVLIGTPHEGDIKKEFETLAAKYRGDQNSFFYFKYDEPLAHLAYASAHFILIPSLFEPCGLTQIISMRYATLPIAHKVGGLKETVFDVDDANIPMEKRNGYTFDFPLQRGLQHGIDRAFKHFYEDASTYMGLLRHSLRKDWSWKMAADGYLQLYSRLMRAREG